jgi:aerotaxis receptor
MVEEASVATGVLDMQTQAVARALEVFKLPPQGGAKGKPGASLVLKKSQATEPASQAEDRRAARRA